MRAQIHSLGTALVLITVAALSGCRNEPNPEKVPEVARVKVEPAKVEVEPDEIKIKPGDVDLEDAYPLDRDDVGKTIFASGTVVGRPIPNGFFLKTKGNQVLFVRTPAQPNVTTGDTVRVLGPLQVVEAPVFTGLKVDALQSKIEAGWKMLDAWVLDATAVSKVTPGNTTTR